MSSVMPSDNMPEEDASTGALVPSGYPAFLTELKERIRTAQVKAALSVNRELVLLYWQIGREILLRQGSEGWGAKVIDRLSRDLRVAFPEMKGFSPRNLKYMRAFAQAWPNELLVQQAAALIPWFHNVAILEKIVAPEQRVWQKGAAASAPGGAQCLFGLRRVKAARAVYNIYHAVHDLL